MSIFLEYGFCLTLAWLLFTLIFAVTLACVLVDEGSLQLGSLVRIIVRRPNHQGLKLVPPRATQATWEDQVTSDRRSNFQGTRGLR
jgi:hypothetical protein